MAASARTPFSRGCRTPIESQHVFRRPHQGAVHGAGHRPHRLRSKAWRSQGSAESLGRHVTVSVVKSIFMVIVARRLVRDVLRRRSILRAHEHRHDGIAPLPPQRPSAKPSSACATSTSASATSSMHERARSRCLSRRGPGLRRRLGHRQVGADAHHPRPRAASGRARSRCSATDVDELTRQRAPRDRAALGRAVPAGRAVLRPHGAGRTSRCRCANICICPSG